MATKWRHSSPVKCIDYTLPECVSYRSTKSDMIAPLGCALETYDENNHSEMFYIKCLGPHIITGLYVSAAYLESGGSRNVLSQTHKGNVY